MTNNNTPYRASSLAILQFYNCYYYFLYENLFSFLSRVHIRSRACDKKPHTHTLWNWWIFFTQISGIWKSSSLYTKKKKVLYSTFSLFKLPYTYTHERVEFFALSMGFALHDILVTLWWSEYSIYIVVVHLYACCCCQTHIILKIYFLSFFFTI